MAVYFVSIKNKYKLKDSNGVLRTIYGGGRCELVNESNGIIRVCLGPNSGEIISNVDFQKLTIDAVINISKQDNLEAALSILDSTFQNVFYEMNNGRAVEINDFELLKQINEIKKNNIDNTPNMKVESGLPDIKDMYEIITSNVICQDEQVKSVLSAIYNNILLSRSNLSDEKISKLKQNVLISGPTGTGKTEIIRQISNIFNIPIVVEDATRFTEAGYVGADIDDVFAHLISKAQKLGGGIELAEKGIIVFDEFDKLANANPDGNDVGKTSVQQSLLTMLEGGIRQIDIGKGIQKKPIEFNTSKLSIVGIGAFSGIEKIVQKKLKLNKAIGFGTQDKKEKIDDKSIYTIEDYIEYGMMSELLGRFGQIVQMNELDKEALKKIVTTSNLSFLGLKQEFYKMMGVNIVYDEDFLEKLCERAAEFGSGARSLNTILNDLFKEIQFNIFANNYSVLELTSETVKDNKKYILR